MTGACPITPREAWHLARYRIGGAPPDAEALRSDRARGLLAAMASANGTGRHGALEAALAKLPPEEAAAIAQQLFAVDPTAPDTPSPAQEAVSGEDATPDDATADHRCGADGFRLTDYGNAERLVAVRGANLRYCHPSGRWLIWTGQRWAPDDSRQVLQLAKSTIRGLYRLAASTEDAEQREAMVRWAIRSEAAARLKAMVELAQSEPGVPVLPQALDANRWLLNVANGTVNLRTGKLQPADPADLLSKHTPVNYDPNAACPLWDAFLEQILPDAAVRTFVQRCAGYGATGDTSEQCLFFFWGGGANGKSTLLTVLQAALGEYARQAAPQLLLSSRQDRHPTEVADLFGARFVASVEVEDGRRFAEVLIKQMTGGDRLKARFMRQDFFEWEPTHKVFLAANHKPVVRGTDYAIWRRIHLVPFTVTIPKEQQDHRLVEKLRDELPGILRWIIEGCLAWQRQGLAVPAAVTQATEAYRAEQDWLTPFLEECCVLQPQARTLSKNLFAAYVAWCEADGEQPVSRKALGAALTERGCTAGKGTGGAREWHGVGLPQPPAGSGG